MIQPTFQDGDLVTSSDHRLKVYADAGSNIDGCWVILFQDSDRGRATVAFITGTADNEIRRSASLDERVVIERVLVDALESWTGDRPWWAADIADILGVDIPIGPRPAMDGPIDVAAREQAASTLLYHGDVILPEGWEYNVVPTDEDTGLEVLKQLVDSVVRTYLEALDGSD